MIKGLFGKTRADGGFDMRFKNNKGGWLGKMGRSSVGGGIARLGVSGYLSAKKAIGDGVSELGGALLAETAPVIIEMINENNWQNDKKRPNNNLNEFITNLPATEQKKKARIIEYIDLSFEKSASLHKRVSDNFYKQIKVENKPEILKKIDVSFSIIHDLMWVNKRFFGENAYSKDYAPSMFKSVSPKKLFNSAKENRALKESAMKYYNNKSDELFRDLFIQILEFYGDNENLGSEHKKKYLKYEKARFEITLLNNPYLSIPKIWFKRVFNIEKEE